MIRLAALAVALLSVAAGRPDDNPWLVFEGGAAGPGSGKHIVLLSGDEEYRSEESMPQLGRILSKHHGFKCTVLFAINRKTGEIDPNTTDNIPGMEAIDSADLVLMGLRFRNLPDDQMKHFVDYVEGGKPVLGMRTSTHAFNIDKKGASAYKKYTWTNGDKDYEKGFGRQVLGETWVNHHGAHGKQATRGVPAEGMKDHPILRGCEDIFGPTDVYTTTTLGGDSKPLVLGQVLEGMNATDKPVDGPKNNPMMPIAWTKSYTGSSGRTARIFTTTMGASQDLLTEGTRRMVINAAYWCLGLEDKIPAKNNVEIVGEWNPTRFGFNGFKKGVKPQDLK
ncbi:MAG TPA: ThuA domain-containing protein [Planctomycetota bacterium]|nr:ThuA domain-containing protein [Planctomycetota bacterium]